MKHLDANRAAYDLCLAHSYKNHHWASYNAMMEDGYEPEVNYVALYEDWSKPKPTEERRVAHYNQLTPAQDERLAMLEEELGEALQVIGKIRRHGYDNSHPSKPELGTNRMRLESELGDITFCIAQLGFHHDIDRIAMNKWAMSSERAERSKKYAHHTEIL